jgi:putative DNA primase/helicase
VSDPVTSLMERLEPPSRPLQGYTRKPVPAVAAVSPIRAAVAALPFEWASEFGPAECIPRQLVEGLLTDGGLSVVYGESNSSKTYFGLEICYRASRGERFLGRRTEKCVVFYIAGEGAGSIKGRVISFVKHHGGEFGHFGLIPRALDLMDPSADVESLIDLVNEKADEVGISDVLIVVDTVARAMVAGNENDAQDMGRLVRGADRIKEGTGAHVLLIHHAGKDATKGARGHSSLRAACDTEIEVTADEMTGLYSARITKQRDLPSKGDRMAYRLVPVEIGRDQWCGIATACAVEEAEASELPKRGKALGPSQQAVMGYLAGQDVGVRKADIVAALEPQGIARPTVYRAINGLLAMGLVTDTMGLVYAPKAT